MASSLHEITTRDYMYIDVRGCARCRMDHVHCLFKPLLNAPDEWNWWGMCPESAQPILMKIVETK